MVDSTRISCKVKCNRINYVLCHLFEGPCYRFENNVLINLVTSPTHIFCSNLERSISTRIQILRKTCLLTIGAAGISKQVKQITAREGKKNHPGVYTFFIIGNTNNPVYAAQLLPWPGPRNSREAPIIRHEIVIVIDSCN